MICPNCGTQNGDSSAFCSNCGAKLANQGVASGLGAGANGSLSFAEGAQKVIGAVGFGILRNPEQYRAFMSDECDHNTREYRVFERNCAPALLDPFANAATNPNGTEELNQAAWMAEQYLSEQRAEDVSTSRNVAASLASAVAAASGQQYSNIPSSGTVFAGARATTPNGGASPNVGVGMATATSPVPNTGPTNQNNDQSNMVPIIVAVAAILVIGGILAFVFLNGKAPTDDSTKVGSTGSISSLNGSSVGSTSSGDAQVVVSFDGGGADSGSMDPMEVKDDSSIVVPKCSYKRDGYEFVSWADEKGNEYEPGDSFKTNKSTTLTAKWSSTKSKQDSSSSSDSGPNTSNSFTAAPQQNNSQSSQKASPAASFPRMWSGTYVGTSSYVGGDHHIDRAVAFNFTSVDDSGRLEGVCYVGTAESGAGETYGTCYVAGHVNWNTGEISFQGTGWIDHGGLGDLREYSGSVNFSSQSMGGTAWDVGTGLYETPWNVSAVGEINIWQNGNLTTIR